MIDISRFDSIIFDLGGVILNIDYHLTIQAFESLGIRDFEARYTQARQSGIFDDLETGRINPGEFRDAIRAMAEVELSDIEIDRAWNAMLLDLPEVRLELLSALKRGHRTFLLSNTNTIHISQLQGRLKKEYGFETLDHLFEKVHLSHNMGLRKPDPQIFNALIEEHSLNPEKTLFIDDSEQHLVGASKVGLVTHHLQLHETIEGLIMIQAS